jgi:hypothetical protein
MLRKETVSLDQEFQEPLGPVRVSDGFAHQLDLLRTGFGDLGLDLDRIWRLPETGTRHQQEHDE